MSALQRAATPSSRGAAAVRCRSSGPESLNGVVSTSTVVVERPQQQEAKKVKPVLSVWRRTLDQPTSVAAGEQGAKEQRLCQVITLLLQLCIAAATAGAPASGGRACAPQLVPPHMLVCSSRRAQIEATISALDSLLGEQAKPQAPVKAPEAPPKPAAQPSQSGARPPSPHPTAGTAMQRDRRCSALGSSLGRRACVWVVWARRAMLRPVGGGGGGGPPTPHQAQAGAAGTRHQRWWWLMGSRQRHLWHGKAARGGSPPSTSRSCMLLPATQVPSPGPARRAPRPATAWPAPRKRRRSSARPSSGSSRSWPSRAWRQSW